MNPASPANEMAKVRMVAEQGLLNLALDVGVKAHMFRFGGIYDPGGSAVDMIIKQEPKLPTPKTADFQNPSLFPTSLPFSIKIPCFPSLSLPLLSLRCLVLRL
ncbi:hypothetical protein V6N13_038945 [Hibiscus sabdariffa]|uniref:Uncharacterized protein n=1 Tax=Hibiscus sabdariffa TaxID=183260 RepID=A0ABR2SXN6_9ROSI